MITSPYEYHYILTLFNMKEELTCKTVGDIKNLLVPRAKEDSHYSLLVANFPYSVKTKSTFAKSIHHSFSLETNLANELIDIMQVFEDV